MAPVAGLLCPARPHTPFFYASFVIVGIKPFNLIARTGDGGVGALVGWGLVPHYCKEHALVKLKWDGADCVAGGLGFWRSRKFCIFFPTWQIPTVSQRHVLLSVTGSCTTSRVSQQRPRKSFAPAKCFSVCRLSDIPWESPPKAVQSDTGPFIIEGKCGFWTAREQHLSHWTELALHQQAHVRVSDGCPRMTF